MGNTGTQDQAVGGGISPSGTASGPPVSGTWATDALVIDGQGTIWFCYAGGTQGSWQPIAGTELANTSLASASGFPTLNSTVLAALTGMSVGFTPGPRPYEVEVWIPNVTCTGIVTFAIYEDGVQVMSDALPAGGAGGQAYYFKYRGNAAEGVAHTYQVYYKVASSTATISVDSGATHGPCFIRAVAC